jgi:glycosyltransferase involved in cell wall biosynthesis
LKNIPKISIGMPVFNGEKSLKKTLITIMNQEFVDFELIISDDASTDSTQKICEEFSRKDNRIRYFRQNKNFGMPVKNFQFVLSKAHGEYFMFASHDDPYHPEFISEMLKIMEFDRNCSLAFCSYSIQNKQGDKSIPITPSSSCSKSILSRYMSRIIDMQPALLYGLFRKKFINEDDLRCFDFFEVDIGLKMSLKGSIRIANAQLWHWVIDGERASYSIYPLSSYIRDLIGKKREYQPFAQDQLERSRMNYLPFYFGHIRLLYSHFGLLKAFPLSVVLTYFIFKKIIWLLFNPRMADLNFKD